MKIDSPLSSQIPQLRKLWQEAFGDTEEFLDTFESTAFSIDRCRCVTIDGKVVAALYWFNCLTTPPMSPMPQKDKPIAYIYAVATAKAYRGQGICHKLMEDTHLHLAKLGYEGAILVPGDKELFKLYEKMGYQTCSHIKTIHCTASAKMCNLRHIDKEEYARLRRLLLPAGGVIQENENLDFLQTYATFYAGTDFLLASHGESDTLYGLELLGNENAAFGIVHALGYAKGSFRTPGGDTPFAMYRPLGDSVLPAPGYFGLAFD